MPPPRHARPTRPHGLPALRWSGRREHLAWKGRHHRAEADCRAVLAVMHAIANASPAHRRANAREVRRSRSCGQRRGGSPTRWPRRETRRARGTRARPRRRWIGVSRRFSATRARGTERSSRRSPGWGAGAAEERGAKRWRPTTAKCTTVGRRRPRVINPGAGGVQFSRVRAQRWRKHPQHAVVLVIVGRVSAFRSVVTTARAAPTPFSESTNGDANHEEPTRQGLGQLAVRSGSSPRSRYDRDGWR